MTSQFPIFSIVIPTYNRPERLSACLESLTKLNYPRDRFEVIVVDDGSPTSIEPIVAPLQEKLSVQVIRQDNAGPAAARNRGAAEAQSQYLAFTDDDCQAHPNWLQALASGFERVPDGLLGGRTLNQLCDNLYSEASQLLLDYLYSYYNGDRAHFFASNNIALPRAVFLKMGGFDTSFPLAAGEDRELCDRALSHGYPLHYFPDALIYHFHHLTLKTFWRQHFNYGRGAFYFHQVRAQRSSEKIRVEPVTFYINLLAYPFSSASPHGRLFLCTLFFVSQVANVFGFFWERKVGH